MAGGADNYAYPAENDDLMTVPLTRENITLLQALSQPSRLRRRVAPNFETVSWDDPDHMQYSLSGYRPPRSEDTATARSGGGVRKTGAYPPQRPSVKDNDGSADFNDDPQRWSSRGGAGGGGGRGAAPVEMHGVDTERPRKYQEYVAPPFSQPSSGRNNNNNSGGDRRCGYNGELEEVEDEDQRCLRRHPERPPPPLPAGRQQQHRSDNDDEAEGNEDYYNDDDGDMYTNEGSEGDVAAGRSEPNKPGRLNMQAFEDQFNRAEQRPARQGGAGGSVRGTGENGTTRREDLPMREIYASRDSDDASYKKRPVDPHISRWCGEQRRAEDDDGSDGDYGYSVDSSRPTRFQEFTASSSEEDNNSNSGWGRRNDARDQGRGGAYGDGEREGRGRPEGDAYDACKNRRQLRDNWEKPRSESDDDRAGRGTTHNAYPPSQRGHRGHPSNDDDKEERQSYDTYDGDADAELCGDVVSCDSDTMAVPSNRQQQQPRRPQPPPSAPHTAARHTAPPPLPLPPAAPMRGRAYPKGPQPVYATREERTLRHTKNTRHNPKAFKNKTTHTWISTNTTTTVILPAATVQLVPMSGLALHVEEIPVEDRWATAQPYMLNAPQQAGYQHRPSQMIVLDDSEDVTANETNGRVASSLPQLPRRAYHSANTTNLHTSMPEL
jgi:hypothetical protein